MKVLSNLARDWNIAGVLRYQSGELIRTPSSNNGLFIKSQANFIWYHLLGRGLVEPIDDFRVTNPASNPPLLDALASRFSANDFSAERWRAQAGVNPIARQLSRTRTGRIAPTM